MLILTYVESYIGYKMLHKNRLLKIEKREEERNGINGFSIKGITTIICC